MNNATLIVGVVILVIGLILFFVGWWKSFRGNKCNKDCSDECGDNHHSGGDNCDDDCSDSCGSNGKDKCRKWRNLFWFGLVLIIVGAIITAVGAKHRKMSMMQAASPVVV